MSFYSQYSDHVMKFYARNQHLESFRSSIDEKNWKAAQKVLRGFTEEEVGVLMAVYTSPEMTIAGAINTVRGKRSQGYVWILVKKVRNAIAKERGLI